MHLPRHTLSSQIVAPAFVSATFTPSYGPPSADPSSSAYTDSAYASTSTSSSYGTAHAASYSHNSGIGSGSAAPKSHLFACATRSGFLVAQTCPLKVVASKSFPASQGGLAIAATIDDTSLVVLVGGGRVPRFAPNKVVIWDESATVSSDRKIGGSEGTDMADQEEEDGDGRSVAASTVFDAGSTFGGGEMRSRPPDLATERAGEPALDDLDSEARPASSSSEGRDHADTNHPSDRGHPMQESRLGLAGLDSSLLREGTETSGQEHESLASSNASLTASMTGSISATTEGLEDPFAAQGDEATPKRTPSPPSIEQPTMSASPSSSASPRRFLRASRPQNVAEENRQSRSTTRITGRDVMELEFGEAVQSVIVRSFDVPLTAKSRDEPLASQGRRTFKMALLVVVLRTKAVVFELGEHISMARQEPSEEDGVSRPSSWGILYRTTIGILDDGRGLVDLVGLPGKRSALLTLSGRQPGHVQLVILSLLSPKQPASATTAGAPISSSGVLASSIIAAHSASLVSLTLSACGSLLATASKKGTLVRVWSTTGTTVGAGKPRTTIKAVLQMELRRGTEQAVILSMAFAPDRSVLAAASDKGTIHFFNLRSEAVGGRASPHARSGSGDAYSSRTPSTGAAPSSPGSGSGFGLSNSAAKYLPSGINQLASQIPSSLLPSYLKSTWSTAQFRIKLRTFAAYSSEERATRKSSSRKGKGRAPPAAGSGGDGGSARGGEALYYSDDVPAGGAGASRSTEGAWATLKGRIEDIRRWEPALDERVFLSWVWVPDPVQADAKLSAKPTTHKGRDHRISPSAGAEVRTGGAQSPSMPPRPAPKGQYQLIALTTSGGWYRISLQDQGQGQGQAGSSAAEDAGDTVLNMYRQSSSSSSSSASSADAAAAAARVGGGGGGGGGGATQTGREAKEGTKLEEYRTFGSKEEQWDTRGGWGE
ncbi:hypothetical protein BCV69DRAFT_294769 [Microstroma glucosiphilum]|uniref:WD40 repeat-like protein n=1 Tax=Pseudomicrostroma glucosiphilum TaxID=1684307 RepID=A0A316U190_9BASI|nr:hypothetical protein BCV69DRAFT_294769 [Pseudomicrostroma glucosiphilum]PWN19149.1 hypothetical protein BCV69DRAFT_294769 [Pseudomicrostroma glucosiphilum]